MSLSPPIVASGAALLAAIRADPEDDLPRLAFADWLEEQGNPESLTRAEFIRAQLVEVAAGIGSPAAIDALLATSRILKRSQRWLAGCDWLYDYRMSHGMWSWNRVGDSITVTICAAEDEDVDLTFRRGFLALVRCSLEHWLRYGSELVGAHPLTRVEL